MAQTLTVKPEYVNKAQVFLDGKTTLLNNNLTQEQLLSIYLKPEFRAFIDITYTNVADSFPENFEIDPNLFHAYDSGEVTHNPAGVYPANTVGKHLNDTAGKVNSLSTVSILPSKILNFAASKKMPAFCSFSRASIGSYVDRFGFIKYAGANSPRFTHDPLTKESLGLMIEESRTNLFTNSIVFSSNSAEITKTVGQIAPDGSTDAILIEKATNTNAVFIYPTSITADGFYCRSIFVKANNSIQAVISFEGVGGLGGGGSLTFDILTKQFSGDTGTVTSYGYRDYADGWVRVFVVAERSATKIISGKWYIGGYGGSNTNNHSMMLWGAQIEMGKSMTTYIPSTGTVSTRQADVLTIPQVQIGQKEGAIVVNGVKRGEWEKIGEGYRRVIAFGNTDLIGYKPNNGINSNDTSGSIETNSSTTDSIGVTYNVNSRKLCANGGVVVQGTSMLGNYNNLMFVGSSTAGNFLNGTIKCIRIYPKVLSDIELVKLTKETDLTSISPAGIPTNSDLNQLAFLDVETIVKEKIRQELSIDGTGASITRNIRRPYNFTFEVVDNAGVTSMTATPATNCVANTDNPLTFTAPVGKTLTYAITPVYEY